MMMNLLKYTLLIFLLSFAACSSEDDDVPGVPNGQPQSGDALELTVSAADFVTDGTLDTRATDNGNKTTFEKGDRVGVIILDKNSHLIYDNIPYEYNNGNWTFDSNNDDGKGGCYYDTKAETYIVYYPYNRVADGVTSVDVLKTKFAPKFNQSEIKDYRSSDLMIWSRTGHLPSSVKELDAKLEHAFASIFLAPTAYRLDDGNGTKGNIKVSDVSLTIGNNIYVPYQTTDGSLRCIVPVDITPKGIRCFYAFNGKTYGNTINILGAVTSNTCYTSAPEIINKTYNLGDAKVGDFYCRSSNNNGYLIPSEVTLTNDQKKACLGIVMKVGRDDRGNWIDNCDYNFKDNDMPMNIHGYVLALYNANGGSSCHWGFSAASVGTNMEQYVGFYGYKNTQTIISSNGNNDLSATFPATYYATKDYDDKHPAPTNSSGWFLPSTGQCWYWFQNKDILLISMNNAEGNGWSNSYWSSSGYNSQVKGVWFMDFKYGEIAYVHYELSSHSVRSCLAF